MQGNVARVMWENSVSNGEWAISMNGVGHRHFCLRISITRMPIATKKLHGSGIGFCEGENVLKCILHHFRTLNRLPG